MKYLIIILFFLLSSFVTAQENLDSLWEDWTNEENDDTIRLKALGKYAWEGFLFTKPDSAFYFSVLQEEFSRKTEHPYYIAQALNIQGLSLYMQGDYLKALEYHKKSSKLRDSIGDIKGLASSYNNIGVIYQVQGKYLAAIDFYLKGIKERKKIEDVKGVSVTYNNIGVIYSSQGNYKKAIEYYTKSLSISEKTGNQNGVATSMFNIGKVYQEQGFYNEAMNNYVKGVKILESIGNEKGKAKLFNNIGGLYRIKKDYSKAIKYHSKSLKIKEKLKDKRGIAYSYSNLGAIQQDLKNYSKAIDFFNNSLEISIELEDEVTIANVYIKLAKILSTQGEVIQAIDYGSKALAIAKENDHLILAMDAYEVLFVNYNKKGDQKKALEMYKLRVKFKDSINSEKNLKATIQQQTKYEYDKQKVLDDAEHEKALALEQEKKKRQKIITIVVSSGLTLVALFLIFVYRRLQITKKQKLVIEAKKREVEQQKEEIEIAHKETERQKEVVEYQKAEVEVINEKLEEVSKEISDSINYAEMIQRAVLPSLDLEDLKNEAFIYFNPKDRVSGDFYWLEQQDEYSCYCVADCTGHGIPGAFISMVGTILLNEIHNSKGINIPNQILDELSRLVKLTLTNKEGYTMKDGMDISFAVLDSKYKILYFSGANNPVWIASSESQKMINKELVKPNFEQEGKYIYEIKGDKQPIGDYGDMSKPFTLHNAKLIEGDCFYLFSDGYVDQFGGERNKKFKAKAFRELLLSLNNESMELQHRVLEQTFLDWKKDTEQIDDVTVMGVRV